jgi:hypothetical protein
VVKIEFDLTIRSESVFLHAQASGKAVKIRRGRAAVSDLCGHLCPIGSTVTGEFHREDSAECHEPENLPAMRDEPVFFPKSCPNWLRESALGKPFKI